MYSHSSFFSSWACLDYWMLSFRSAILYKESHSKARLSDEGTSILERKVIIYCIIPQGNKRDLLLFFVLVWVFLVGFLVGWWVFLIFFFFFCETHCSLNFPLFEKSGFHQKCFHQRVFLPGFYSVCSPASSYWGATSVDFSQSCTPVIESRIGSVLCKVCWMDKIVHWLKC